MERSVLPYSHPRVPIRRRRSGAPGTNRDWLCYYGRGGGGRLRQRHLCWIDQGIVQ